MAAEAHTFPDLADHRRMVVCERLRTRRRELGLTQKEVVARLRRLGVDTTNKQLSALEHGAGLDVARLPELAGALDCTLTWLVGLTEDCHRWEPDPEAWSTDARAPEAPRPTASRNGNGARMPPPEGGTPRIIGPLAGG